LIRPLLSRETIAARVRALAEEIAAEHPDEPLHLLVVLRGAFVFAADLARRLHETGIEVTIGFCRVASYGNRTESDGRPRVELPSAASLAGCGVLIVEDIVDSGRSLKTLSRALGVTAPRFVRSVVLLSKPARRKVVFDPDFVGFVVPDRFLVGYGLDHAGRYRELPFIGELLENETESAQGR